MADFKYLWINRARFSFFEKALYIAYAKRILTIRGLFKRNIYRYILLRRGALIGVTSEVFKIEVQGSFKNLKIGENTFIGACSMMLHDNIEIGDNVCINEGVRLLTASHNLHDSNWKAYCRPIKIGNYAWIGTGALIMPGVSIGKGGVVGAGAVVSKDVEPFTIVVGNPSVPLIKKRIEILDYSPCDFLAANIAWLKG